eukprot:CAMPEP_0176141726 /NCGR_PEP_ID=MMETSP0120_2-20121206/72074_1 /TAXON_ID=160619 /ORGANISM="Kryptoperidinium foliaceum, Strain CCMP 1326" /LENGTH=91 /DNA_ID=CAMNT_0017477881 /DNA_START=51 /DNA_END=323 /DNA_ORIENTATION=-
MHVGVLVAGGPKQGQVHNPPLGVPFTYTLEGWGLTRDDRIRIIDHTYSCGNDGAERMSGGVWHSSVPVLGPSLSSGDDPGNLTSVAWEGII